MTPSEDKKAEVDRFIIDQIDSVPHLEALLLLSNSRSVWWTLTEVAERLYVDGSVAKGILNDLIGQRLIVTSPAARDEYSYQAQEEERDRLLAAVDATYRREMVRISTMIHSKASPAVREFARAFRFKKERE